VQVKIDGAASGVVVIQVKEGQAYEGRMRTRKWRRVSAKRCPIVWVVAQMIYARDEVVQ